MCTLAYKMSVSGSMIMLPKNGFQPPPPSEIRPHAAAAAFSAAPTSARKHMIEVFVQSKRASYSRKVMSPNPRETAQEPRRECAQTQ